MWNVSWNSGNRNENVEYENFLSDIFIENFVEGLREKGYTDIKISEYNKTSDGLIVSTDRQYVSEFGDDRICICGKSYYEHFNPNKKMKFCGCKECGCETFIEKKS